MEGPDHDPPNDLDPQLAPRSLAPSPAAERYVHDTSTGNVIVRAVMRDAERAGLERRPLADTETLVATCDHKAFPVPGFEQVKRDPRTYVPAEDLFEPNVLREIPLVDLEAVWEPDGQCAARTIARMEITPGELEIARMLHDAFDAAGDHRHGFDVMLDQDEIAPQWLAMGRAAHSTIDQEVEARTRAILAMTGRDGTIDPEAVERRYLPRPRTAAEVAFRDFGKIPRLATMTAVVTEKLDGTNAQIYVHPDGTVRAASRNRWITPEADNYGFAAWVAEHAEVLRRLGPGRHYGEWYGTVPGREPGTRKAIGRGYDLTETRLALFSARWREKGLPEGLPANVHPVREVYRGGWFGVAEAITNLYATGSITVPGWRKPEGAVVELGGQRWKVTDLAPGKKNRE